MFSTYLVALLFYGMALTSANGYKAERTPRDTTPVTISPYKAVQNIVYGSSYDRLTPPGSATTGESTIVRTGVYVSLLQVDEESMTAKVVMYFRQSWIDARLSFSPTGTGSASRVRWFDLDALWLPDTFFRTVTEPIEVDHASVKITADGSVWFVQRVFANFAVLPASSGSTAAEDSTNEDTTAVPEADFIVPITIESFGHMNDTLSLSTLDSQIQLSDDIYDPNYYIVGTQNLDCTEIYVAGTFSCVDLRIYLLKEHGKIVHEAS